MKPTVLILTGLPGCGKTTATIYFKKKNIPVIRMGDITDKALKQTDLSGTAENEKRIREHLRDKYGEDVYAKKTTEKILPLLANHSAIVIDGLRSEVEFEYFKQHLPDVKLIFCETAQALRYERLSRRKDRPLTEAQARERDMSELSRLGLHTLRKSADFVIHNNGTKKQLFLNLDKVFKKLNTG